MAKKNAGKKSATKSARAERAAARRAREVEVDRDEEETEDADEEETATATRAARAARRASADEEDRPQPDPAKKGVKGLRTIEARNPGTGKVPTPHQSVATPTPRNDRPTFTSLREQTRLMRDKLRKIKPVRVVAVERGYYGDRLWEVGEKFDMKIDPDIEAPRWVALVKGKSAQTSEEEFGPDEDDTHDEDKDEADEDGDEEEI
jgi:hypothetical protein